VAPPNWQSRRVGCRTCRKRRSFALRDQPRRRRKVLIAATLPIIAAPDGRIFSLPCFYKPMDQSQCLFYNAAANRRPALLPDTSLLPTGYTGALDARPIFLSTRENPNSFRPHACRSDAGVKR